MSSSDHPLHRACGVLLLIAPPSTDRTDTAFANRAKRITSASFLTNAALPAISAVTRQFLFCCPLVFSACRCAR